MARVVAGMFSMINITTMRDTILRGAVTIRFVVGISQAVDRSRSRNECNRDWRSHKASQSERGKKCPDTGSNAFGQPIQHFLRFADNSNARHGDYPPDAGTVK
jgi:hypothetical protein